MSRCFLILLSAALVSVAPAQKPATYDEAANAHELIDAALTKARRDDKRVMVVFGANWCGWCHKLADAFKRRELRRQASHRHRAGRARVPRQVRLRHGHRSGRKQAGNRIRDQRHQTRDRQLREAGGRLIGSFS